MPKYLLILFLLISNSIAAQTTISLDSAIELGLKNHPQIHLADQAIEEQKVLRSGSFDLANPDIFIESPSSTGFTIGFQQTFDNPIIYLNKIKVAKQKVSLSESGSKLTRVSIITQAKTAYLNLQFEEIKLTQLLHQDSLLKNIAHAAKRRYKIGEATLLESVSAEAAFHKATNLLNQAKADIRNAQIQLQLTIGSKDDNLKSDQLLSKKQINTEMNQDLTQTLSSPLLGYAKQQISLNRQSLILARSKLSPGFSVGYLNQGDDASEMRYRFQFGLSLPLWFWTYASDIKAARIRHDMANKQLVLTQLNLNSKYSQAITDYKKHLGSLSYYETLGLNQAETIISTASRSYQAGEIDYITYTQSLNQAFQIKMDYYEAIKNYNQSIIQLQYLNGQL